MRHPYNKGNGAAVKSGIRAARGEFVLVIDADGQHQPADARRLVSRLGEYDLVVGRARARHAGLGRAAGGQRAAQRAGELPHGPADPGPHLRLPGARREHLLEFLHLLPNGFSTPTTTTLAFVRAGYNVAFEPIEARQRVGKSKIRLARDGFRFFLILLKVITIFSPLRIFAAARARRASSLGVAYGGYNFAVDHKIPNGAVLLIMFGGHRVPRRPGLGADLGAARRRTPLAPRRRDDARRGLVLGAVALGLALRLAFGLSIGMTSR